MGNLKKIYLKAVSGSRLYGTANADSDYDYKVIIEPSVKDILLGNGRGSSHVIEDEDSVYWTYQKWVELLLKMDSNAFEVYLANLDLGLVNYPLPGVLWDERGPAVGFVGSQMTRYANRGERLANFISVLEVLHQCTDLREAAYRLVGHPGVVIKMDPYGIPLISVHEKAIPVNSKLKEAIKLYQRQVDSAGDRAMSAIGSKDWKGIAHGFRIAKQMIELVETGNIVFPLQYSDVIADMRYGRIEFDTAVNMVEEAVARLRDLPPSSHLCDNKKDATVVAEYCITNFHSSVVLGPL